MGYIATPSENLIWERTNQYKNKPPPKYLTESDPLGVGRTTKVGDMSVDLIGIAHNPKIRVFNIKRPPNPLSLTPNIIVGKTQMRPLNIAYIR